MLNTQYHETKYFTLNEINDSLNDSTDRITASSHLFVVFAMVVK